jgi:putative ABC transport system substrate-binding protein
MQHSRAMEVDNWYRVLTRTRLHEVTMRRREFITLLGSVALPFPPSVRAQKATMPVIGFLDPRSPEAIPNLMRAFLEGLKETGHAEGENVAVEYRWAEDQIDQLPGLAADLVRRQVTVIAAPGSISAVLAAHAATTTIPIVFGTATDPVQLGLVASLSRPGGNMTGVITLALEAGPKRLELLHEMLPTATTMALLVNPSSPALSEPAAKDAQAAARLLGVNLHVLHAKTAFDFDRVFTALIQLRAGGLVIGADALFTGRAQELAALALRHRVPAIYQYSEFASAGGLMSYGGSIRDTFHQVGVYVGRILKDERPADMPVAQSTKAELVVNLNTAKALGLAVPSALLARADEVIE